MELNIKKAKQDYDFAMSKFDSAQNISKDKERNFVRLENKLENLKKEFNEIKTNYRDSSIEVIDNILPK